MTYNKLIVVVLLTSLTLSSCGQSESTVTTTPPPLSPPGNNYVAPVGSNVMQVTIDGSLCGASKYINEPCTQVKICAPGSTTNCTIVNNILVDSGSFGLRIFSSALNGVSLTPVLAGNGNPLGTCATFGTGADWGSVQLADVVIGDLSGAETASNIPIQVIDSSFSNFSAHISLCSNGQVDNSPTDTGFNGILGIGVFQEDCGHYCTTNAGNGTYFSCNGANCVGTTVPLANQVVNPVAKLPVDNNGVVLMFPGIFSGGTPNVSGSMVLGVGTKTNNTPTLGINTYQINSANGELFTYYKNVKYSAIIDSGTNTYSFNDSSISRCASNSAFYCPASELGLTAVQQGLNVTSTTVPFIIGNIDSFSGQNWVFNDIGTSSSNLFIWGLPFFLGRNVYFGFESKNSVVGSGTYVAY